MSAKSRPVFTLLLCATVLLGLLYFQQLTQDTFLDIGSFADEGYVRGFYGRENVAAAPYRWSSGHSSLLFPSRGQLPLAISVAADAPHPEGHSQPDVSVVANGQLIGQFVAESGVREYSFQYRPSSIWPTDLLLEISTATFAPPSDPRDLGLLVNSVTLRPDGALSPLSQLWLILLSAIPGAILVVASYLVLYQARIKRVLAVLLALFLLSLLAWAVHRDTVTMRLIVSLDIALLVATGLMFLICQLGWQVRLASLVCGWCSNAGRSIGLFRSRVFTWEFVTSRRYRVGTWLKMHRLDLAIGAILFVSALFVRLPYYLEMPHITDEFREVQIAAEVAEGTYYPLFFSTTDYLGVVHSYLLGFFLRLLGISLYTPRLYIVGMGALTVVLTYWLAREMRGRLTSVLAACLMLFSPMHILIGSHVAWMNSTTPVFCLLLFITFYRGVMRDSGFCLALSGFFAGVSLQTHPTVALVFPGMTIWYALEQRKRDRPLIQWVQRPALYFAAFLFLLAYGNIIWYNSHGKIHALAAAQRRDSMRESSLNLWVYLQTLQNLLQNLLSSISGTFELHFSSSVFARPSMLFYGSWLLASLVHVACRKKLFLLLLLTSPLLLLPFLNQNWSIPDRSRYLAFLLPLCYIAMAWFLVRIVNWIRNLDLFLNRRAVPNLIPVLFFCGLLVFYPLLPLWNYYREYGDSEWSNRTMLQATEILREYRELSTPIGLDTDLRHWRLPIVGSNLLKSIEYLLFLDGTDSVAVSFEAENEKFRTFNHDGKVMFWSSEDVPVPSVWVLTPKTRKRLMFEGNLDLINVSKFDDTETRFGVYVASH